VYIVELFCVNVYIREKTLLKGVWPCQNL